MVVFTAPASAKCCTVTNTAVANITIVTKSGKEHTLDLWTCIKLKKSDFPIKAGDGKCHSSGNYAVVRAVKNYCVPTVYNDLC